MTSVEMIEDDSDFAEPQSHPKERNYLEEAIKEMIKLGELPNTKKGIEDLIKKKKKTCQGCDKKEVFTKRVGKGNNFVCETCESEFNKGLFNFNEKGEKQKETKKSSIEEIDLNISSQATFTHNSPIFEEIFANQSFDSSKKSNSQNSQSSQGEFSPPLERVLFETQKPKVPLEHVTQKLKLTAPVEKPVSIPPPSLSPIPPPSIHKRIKEEEEDDFKENKRVKKEKKEKKEKKVPKEPKEEKKVPIKIEAVKVKVEVKKEQMFCDYCHKPKKLSELSKRVSPIEMKHVCRDCELDFQKEVNPTYNIISVNEPGKDFVQNILKLKKMPSTEKPRFQISVTGDGKKIIFCNGSIVSSFILTEQKQDILAHKLIKNWRELIMRNNDLYIYLDDGNLALMNVDTLTKEKLYQISRECVISFVKQRGHYSRVPKEISEDLIQRIKNSKKIERNPKSPWVSTYNERYLSKKKLI